MIVLRPSGRCPRVKCNFTQKEPSSQEYTKQPMNRLPILICKRQAVLCSFTATLALLTSSPPTWAEKKSGEQPDEESDAGIFGAVKSLLDPNETTKSGKVLPKAYLKSARDVVKNLRESLKEDPNDNAKFRRTADAAKESIRDYMSSWRGQQSVSKEESYMELEKVIRTLASFYSNAGPSAPLPEGVKSEILVDLETAEKYL